MVSYLCKDINSGAHIIDEKSLIKRHSVYAVIASRKGFLLVAEKGTAKLEFNFPGGGIEIGESQNEALAREIREETGLEIASEPAKLCEFIEYFYDLDSEKGWRSQRTFFSVDATGKLLSNGNNYDVVKVKYFDNPLNESNVSEIVKMIVQEYFTR